jgi:hypothetical protein
MNRHLHENLPYPLFTKEGDYSSLWKREGRRDFMNMCSHYYETIKNANVSYGNKR